MFYKYYAYKTRTKERKKQSKANQTEACTCDVHKQYDENANCMQQIDTWLEVIILMRRE